MASEIRYAIQCFDPEEPNSWFILSIMYKDREEAQAICDKLEKSEQDTQYPCRFSGTRILKFAIEVSE